MITYADMHERHRQSKPPCQENQYRQKKTQIHDYVRKLVVVGHRVQQYSLINVSYIGLLYQTISSGVARLMFKSPTTYYSRISASSYPTSVSRLLNLSTVESGGRYERVMSKGLERDLYEFQYSEIFQIIKYSDRGKNRHDHHVHH